MGQAVARERAMERLATNRWLIAVAGVVMQLALGTVYAWSVFRIPLTSAFGWAISQVTLAFTIAILMLGFAAFVGGLWMRKVGPRTVGIAAGVAYGFGVFLASLSGNGLWVLYLTYGFLGGIGLGLGYIVPVTTLLKWFPDKRGFITGIAVAGFGAGALITAPIATRLIQSMGVLTTFAILGIVYFIMVVGGALFMKNPPEGWLPAGWGSPPRRNKRSVSPLTIPSGKRCGPGSGTPCGPSSS
jgi:OFA family oxalate/formate antiporter-like MFS transporter